MNKIISSFKYIKKNLIFASIIFIVFNGSDYFYSLIDERYKFLPDINYLFGVYFLFFISSFCKSTVGLFFFLSYITFSSFLQYTHIGYFGTLIEPNEYFLFFNQLHEITNSIQDWGKVIVYPFFILSFCVFIKLIIYKKLNEKRCQSHILTVVFLLILIYGPYKIIVFNDSFGRRADANASTFYNSYSTLSYFFVNLLPKIIFDQQLAGEIRPSPVPKRNPSEPVIFVIGESLSFRHMSLFGYSKKTTPFLDSLHKDQKIIARKAISCGVSTDVAIPMLVHQSCGIDVMPQIISGNSCLMKLANKNGYQVSFFTSQSGQELKGIYNYLCPGSIHDYQDGSSQSQNYDANANDLRLIPLVENLDWSQKKKFVVLQMRSAHSPYDENYPSELEIFRAKSEETWEEKRIRTYDNSVHLIDFFIKELISVLEEKIQGKYHLVFIPDHGQSVGENGRFGHLQLVKEQYQIPFFYYSNSEIAASVAKLQLREWYSMKEVSRLVAYLLGYFEDWEENPEEIMVLGTDIEGHAGYLKLNFENGAFVESYRY